MKLIEVNFFSFDGTIRDRDNIRESEREVSHKWQIYVFGTLLGVWIKKLTLHFPFQSIATIIIIQQNALLSD